MKFMNFSVNFMKFINFIVNCEIYYNKPLNFHEKKNKSDISEFFLDKKPRGRRSKNFGILGAKIF